MRIQPGVNIHDRNFRQIFRQAAPSRRIAAPRRSEPLKRGGCHHAYRFAREAAKRFGAACADLVDIARCEDAIAHDYQHPSPRSLRITGHAHGIGEVSQTVVAHSIGRPHRTHHHDRFVRRQSQIEQESGFFQRIGTVRNDKPVAFLVSKGFHRARMQRVPDGGSDIGRIDIRDLRS
mgnify:CR=1 FL=1